MKRATNIAFASLSLALFAATAQAQEDCPCRAGFGAIVVNSTECTQVSAAFTLASDGRCDRATLLCVEETTDEPCHFTYSFSVTTGAGTLPDCCGTVARALKFEYGNLDYGRIQENTVTLTPIGITLPFGHSAAGEPMACYSYEAYQVLEASTCPPTDPATGFKETILLQFSKNCEDCL
ncbi:MAG: hypothetical protein IT457_23215 [Planctomycetes bacterium]|nr:hypothetical protein [Planctomycetota bacterium]